MFSPLCAFSTFAIPVAPLSLFGGCAGNNTMKGFLRAAYRQPGMQIVFFEIQVPKLAYSLSIAARLELSGAYIKQALLLAGRHKRFSLKTLAPCLGAAPFL
jgi:hypothetical protein